MLEKPVNIMILLSCFIYYISEMASFNGRDLYHYILLPLVCGGWMMLWCLVNHISTVA